MPAAARRTERPRILRAPALSRFRWLLHGFSTRRGGVSRRFGGKALNLGFGAEDSRTAVEKNRRRFLAELPSGSRAKPALITLRQVHSDVIHVVDRVPSAPLVGDGLLTNVAGLVLAVQTADCLPVLLADPEHHAVGVFHAGWRGTLARIVEKGVGMMRQRYQSDPRKLVAAIGPGIHSCCYEVGGEVRERFEAQFDYAAALFHEVSESDPVREKYPLLFLTARAPGHSELGPKLHLDLVGANRRQLVAAGLRPRHIWASPLCTSCRVDLLFSHRGERGKTGRMMGAVGLRSNARFKMKNAKGPRAKGQ